MKTCRRCGKKFEVDGLSFPLGLNEEHFHMCGACCAGLIAHLNQIQALPINHILKYAANEDLLSW